MGATEISVWSSKEIGGRMFRYVHDTFLIIVSVSLPMTCMELESVKKCKPELSICKASKKATYALEDIFRNKFFPQLTLQDVLHLGATCKEFHSYCTYDKICSLDVKIPCLKQITENYFYAGCVLSDLSKRLKNEQDKERKGKLAEMFDALYAYHEILRNEDIKQFRTFISKDLLCGKIAVYQKNYNTIEKVKNRICQQLKEAIKTTNISFLKDLIYDRSYNLFTIFPTSDRSIKKRLSITAKKKATGINLAVKNLCWICLQEQSVDILCRFMKNEKPGNRKNLLIYCVFRYGTDDLVCALFHRRIFMINEKFAANRTALHYAAGYNYHGLIKLLCDNGHNVKICDHYKSEALYYASTQGTKETQDLLAAYYDKK